MLPGPKRRDNCWDVLEILVISLVSLLVLAGIARIGSGVSDRVVGLLSSAVTGWRAEGWPRGIQEEDRDAPWNRSRRRREQHRQGERQDAPELVPTLARVKQSVRIR